MNSNSLNRLIAIVVAVVLHVAVLLILGTIVLTAEPVKPLNDGGIYVQIGNIDEANGVFEPYIPEPEVVETEPSPEELITQDSEETVSLEEQRKKEEEEERLREEEQARLEAEARLREEQQAKENKVSNAMQNAFGANSESTGQGVEAEGDGIQGSYSGNSSEGSMTGTGGWGGFSLAGRRCVELPKPTYNSNAVGTVVIEITVDSEGRVVAATVKAGSATHESLRSAALAAAKKARFDRTSKSGNQVGTITYNFRQR